MTDQPNPLKNLLGFLEMLEEARIWYRLSKIRDAVLVEIAVPGQRWEVEFFADGSIEREVFESTNDVEGVPDVGALNDLIGPWSDLRKAHETDA